MTFYLLKKEDVFKKLNTSIKGLTEKEASKRIQKFGFNVLEVKKEISFFQLFLEQFKSYLVWLLIFIALIAFFSGFYFNKKEQIIDGFIISLIVFVNAFVGAYQDYKSEKTAETLKRMLKNEALVLRDGKKKKVNSELLVPGDIIFLEEGSKVPADCRIISSKELRVDESLLTGESREVFKHSKKLNRKVPLSERKNMVFMNTFVVSGFAICVVVNTGKNTEVGKIAESLNIKNESPFVKEVDSASKKITYVALSMIFFVALIFLLRGYDLLAIFMISSALIIGAIPEGLPAIVTFSLSMAALKLSKKNVLVKRKSLLETFGSVDVICTDKTGTLTENKMVVKKLFFDMEVFDGFKKKNFFSKMDKKVFFHFRNCALLANEVKDTDKGLQGNSEDVALVDFFNDLNTDIFSLKEKYETLSFSPFSSEKKFVSSKNLVDNIIIEYKKGAPEVILEEAEYFFAKGKIKKLSLNDKKLIFKKVKYFSNSALRVIAFSLKFFSGKNKGKKVFLGFVGLYDKPKKGVFNAVKTLYSAGIEVKMITGDGSDTAVAVAKECGFKNIKVVSWDELKDLSYEQLKVKVKECNVFSRMSPEFKLKIVSAIQENGSRVGITGDGVNDVPALKKAEVGIAMNSGTDIAKEAGDLILLDNDFSNIVHVVKEGRTVFSNVRKVLNYLLTANLAEVFVVFLGSLWGVMPFSAIQLLWVNFVTDVAPAISLGVDPSHKNILKYKPTGKDEKLLNKRITLLTVFIGLKKVFLMFFLFFFFYKTTNNLVLAQTVSFTWLVLSHFVRIAAIRFDEHVNLFYNKYVNYSVLVPVLLQLFIIYTPISKFFHVVPLSFFDWSIIFFSFVVALFLAKIITFYIDKFNPRSEDPY